MNQLTHDDRLAQQVLKILYQKGGALDINDLHTLCSKKLSVSLEDVILASEELSALQLVRPLTGDEVGSYEITSKGIHVLVKGGWEKHVEDVFLERKKMGKHEMVERLADQYILKLQWSSRVAWTAFGLAVISLIWQLIHQQNCH